MTGSQASVPADDRAWEVAHGAVRGAIAAMAMTGMRRVTVELGLVEHEPPETIFRQRGRGILRRVPRDKRRTVVELAHWGFGAGGGMAFGALPDAIRRRAWAGPVYGVGVWLGFELVIAPALGLVESRRVRVTERLALAADHLLYGLVLSEVRRRPQS